MNTFSMVSAHLHQPTNNLHSASLIVTVTSLLYYLSAAVTGTAALRRAALHPLSARIQGPLSACLTTLARCFERGHFLLTNACPGTEAELPPLLSQAPGRLYQYRSSSLPAPV